MLKIEQALHEFAHQWSGTKTTVLDESAALAARLDRIEQKLDEALAEIRSIKDAAG